MTHTQRFWVVLFMINTNYVHEFQGEEKGRKEEEGRIGKEGEGIGRKEGEGRGRKEGGGRERKEGE